MRHGPLSALDERTMVVAYLSGDTRRRAFELDLLDEIHGKGLGLRRVAVFNGGELSPPGGATDFVSSLGGAPIADVYRPAVDTIFGQLFGLFCSVRHGLAPDTPSPNGVITRVVSSVQIHGLG